MNIPFWKMHGAGNDFIMVDDRAKTFPVADRAWIASVARRRFGVGCDGVILVQPADDTADFRMVFYNPDGSEVEMCGNGARCVARLANDIGVAGAEMAFDTVAGEIKATVEGDQVTLQMTEPFDWAFDQSIDIDGTTYTFHQVNSGVPHVVVEVADVEAIDLMKLGAAIRYDARFPKGTNANFIQITGPDALRVRTYERGVEAETLACGTGMVACGLIAGKRGRVTIPVKITCASGDVLEIAYEDAGEGAGEGAAHVTLKGPAVHVFAGELDYPGA
ncbi:MAG: diaminopimelate epimerase [Kiritimatiellia bacterium]|jgi:diaminopimelate epimerase